MTDVKEIQDASAGEDIQSSSKFYDESYYPAKAESDEEMDSTLETADYLQGVEDPPETASRMSSEDMSCIVCAEMFVDPCTLQCGHSFCQLCLASIWKSKTIKSPLYLQCPVCRQPWANFPGINIQLRNIIEKTQKDVVDSRRTLRSESNLALLTQYNHAKDNLRLNRQRNILLPQRLPARWCLLFLAVLLCGVVLIILAGVILLAMSSASGEFMRKPVSRWSNADVMAWVGGLGNWAAHNISHTLSKEKISGPQLLLLDQKALRGFGIHDDFHIQSLLLAIEQLRQENHSTPRNFHEFMAAHRKETVLIGILYSLWPRLTFLYIYYFNYYDIFLPIWSNTVGSEQADSNEVTLSQEPSSHQLLVYGLEIILIPHYVVGLCAWYWFDVHPWLCTAILIHCLWSTQREAKLAISRISTLNRMNWKQNVSQLIWLFGASLLCFTIVAGVGLVLWPLIPYFLCNMLFYCLVWNTTCTLSMKTIWFIAPRRRRLHHQDVIP